MLQPREQEARARDLKDEMALKAALLRYEEKRSEKEIAKALRVSNSTVSRYLNYARQIGLVHIAVSPRPNIALGKQLEGYVAGFGVSKVIVAGTSLPAVGQAAARLFEACGKRRVTAVLDGGLTLSSFVEALFPGVFEQVTIVPICADPASYPVSAYELMARMATKYPVAHCMKLPHLKGKLLEPLHRSARKAAEQADFIFLGTGPWQGGFTALNFVRHLGLNPNRLRSKYRRVAGVCGYCALDAAGKQIAMREVDRRLPRSLTFPQLRRMASSGCTVAVLAASGKKLKPLLAVLMARMCNTLILDEELATVLLDRVTISPDISAD